MDKSESTSAMTMVRAALVAAGAGACIFFTLMMPWAELHMETDPAKMPWTLQLLKIDKPTAELFNKLWAEKRADHEKFLADRKAEGKYGEYVYAFAMALAMSAATLAIVAIGSEDEAEKTLIPSKK